MEFPDMDRRDFLLSTAATTLAALSTRALAQAAPAGDTTPELNAAFDQIFNIMIDNSPESATALGLDKGPRAAMKGKLDDNSLAAVKDDFDLAKKSMAILDGFKGRTLTDKDQLNLACIRYTVERSFVAPEKYDLSSIARPYRIFQQGGAYFEQPDFLSSAHTIATKEDCDAYLSRLDAFATQLDNDSDVQRAYAARGHLAPAWSLDLTLGQMKTLRDQPAATSSMAKSLADRAKAANIDGDWAAQAGKIIDEKIYPALDKQMALITELKRTTRVGDGVWRVPKGDELYADALALSTTTSMTPDEVHQMGLDQVREISAELDGILKANGLTAGSVGARLTALNTRPDQLYPNTAEGRAALLKSLNADYLKCKALLPKMFNNPSNAPLEIRAVPVEIQDGASNGYYRRAALDGSRPAIYFINLKEVADWPKYGLPALTYHEGVPGHHLQISTMQEAGTLPILRRVGGYSAYSEGWALYAEEVASELGAYATPLERAGYLQSFLFRAARLAVDTGLHARKWTREQATNYMVEVTGFAQPRCLREVERYCTQPGQATSYKVGHAAWTRARAKAQKTLGSKFDLKTFHEVLKDGAMPLTILEQRIEARTAAAMKG
jgi:uncharacterized protein (DUF885 family)